MDSYMFVYLQTDEDNLLPRHVSWIEEDSVPAYQRQVEQALIERWPGVEVDVTTYHHELHVETDVQDCTEEEVRVIVEAVWSRFEWLATDTDENGRFGFRVTWTDPDGNADLIGDPTGYSTLTDASITAREFFEPENSDGDEIPGVTKIWLGDDVVATYVQAEQL